MTRPTRYRDLTRHVKHLYMAETAGWALGDWERRRLIESVENTLIAADLAWPGDEADGPRSISGSDHIRDHIAHDWALSERDEVRFRAWWYKMATYSFLAVTTTKEDA